MSDNGEFNPVAGGPGFSLANRLERVLWQACWLLLCRWTPPPLHAWRRWILGLFGAEIGKGARVHASVHIWLPRNLSIGPCALVGPGAIIYNQGHITIGARSVISQRAHLCASTHSLTDPLFPLVLKPIRIGDACWVAAEAFIGPGVTLGAGSVVSARAAIFEDTEPLGIYRGNPASLIGQRQLGGRPA